MTPVKLISIAAVRIPGQPGYSESTTTLYALDDQGRTWCMDREWRQRWELIIEAPTENIDKPVFTMSNAERKLEGEPS